MGDSLRRSTARSCSVAISLTDTLLILFLRTYGTDAGAAQRQSNPQQQKVYLKINIDKLSLVWNGDQGESGRGRGEVFVSTWIFWPSKVEKENPQHKELGPLNGDVEFKSGTIVEDPPGSGQRRIQPATVPDKQFGMIYFNQADCPVSTRVLVDVLVWDEDSNKDLADYKKLVEDARDAATAAGVKGATFAASILNTLLEKLTASADDALGRFTGSIDIPDPCQGDFGPIPRTLDLKNLAADLWLDVEAEDETGIKFGSVGILPPSVIGSLELTVQGGLEVNKFSASEEKPIDPLAFRELIAIDLGQPDESVITGVLSLGASLPQAPPPITYSLFLDVDNDASTGARDFPAEGAEFEVQAAVGPSDPLVARLFRFDPVTQARIEVPNGVYDASINIDRADIFLSVDLATLGNPAGPVAAWGAVHTDVGLTDVFPATPTIRAPIITLSRDFIGLPPLVVTTEPSHDAVDVVRSIDICVTFAKSMHRPQTEAAFKTTPSVAGSFFWRGNTLCLRPSSLLAPFTRIDVLIEPTATDTVGTPLDGNGDLVPGDSFTWAFVTEALPLSATNGAGIEPGGFFDGEPVFAVGSAFSPGIPVDIYVVRHSREALTPGAELVDVTDDGATPATIDALGALTLTLVGRVPVEGEYNLVVDLNLNGRFDPGIDRIDRTGIGVVVLPRPRACDVNADGDIDRNDIRAIFARRNTPAAPGDPFDADGDGTITLADARACTLLCTRPNCDPQ